ncbi:unnamed protein product [Paramecium sonneborni]|uniref:Transmembrane protein n=1 Tax=Paramecium sonneborni TaxID=65129 RepID=A0A8S1L114_9CILI|nr:unnamed protein product [Paramecium sonneborni]
MQLQLINRQLPTSLKKSLRLLIVSITLSLLICLAEGIAFTHINSEINNLCGLMSAYVIQVISCFIVLISLLLNLFSIFKMSKSYLLIGLVLSIIFKFISMIMIRNSMNQIQGGCYFSRFQITSFLISDLFWIVLLLFYYSTISNLYQKFPEIFFLRFNFSTLWKN